MFNLIFWSESEFQAEIEPRTDRNWSKWTKNWPKTHSKPTEFNRIWFKTDSKLIQNWSKTDLKMTRKLSRTDPNWSKTARNWSKLIRKGPKWVPYLLKNLFRFKLSYNFSHVRLMGSSRPNNIGSIKWSKFDFIPLIKYLNLRFPSGSSRISRVSFLFQVTLSLTI